jgi:F-type H+-transporting ATPase subunit b
MNYLILAAEAAEEASTLQVILPATAELVYGAIAFIIVFLVLARVALPRMNTMLDERTEAIQGQMEAAERAKQEASADKQAQQAEIAAAKQEAQRIIEEAKQAADQVRRDLIADGESQKAAIVASGQTEIDAERDRLLQELRGEVGTLSVQLAGKIVEKELDAAAHQGLVDEYIAALSRSN